MNLVVAAYLGMRTGRPKKPLQIVDADREKLSMIARRPKSSQAMAMRARIVLNCGHGMSNSEVARKLHITGATVGKWRERFREFGMDGLLDEPRVGAPRKITDLQIEEVITKTLETTPANSTHWSTRLMAEEVGLTPGLCANRRLSGRKTSLGPIRSISRETSSPTSGLRSLRVRHRQGIRKRAADYC